MTDRLKILDCNRKAILGLPDGALKVWLCRFMNEDEDQESWLSLPEVEAQTSMSHPTCVKWHKFLVTHKWLVPTGKTAADKWIAIGKTPTPGSFQIEVYRVDDPTSKNGLVENSHETEENREPPVKNFNQLNYLTSKEIEHKVSCSLSVYGSNRLDSSSLSESGSSSSTNKLPHDGESKTIKKPDNLEPKNLNLKPPGLRYPRKRQRPPRTALLIQVILILGQIYRGSIGWRSTAAWVQL